MLPFSFFLYFLPSFFFFFFNDTATTEIYTLSLHDALPIFPAGYRHIRKSTEENAYDTLGLGNDCLFRDRCQGRRSEEHTSELQSQSNLVCRLLLEKKKKKKNKTKQNQNKEANKRSQPKTFD